MKHQRKRSTRILTWAAAIVLGLLVLVVGGTWLYINVIRGDAPAPLSFEARDAAASSTTASPASTGGATTTAAPTSSAAQSTTDAASALAGTWSATPQSEAGYRIKEVLFGQSTEAVGRTNAVTGQMTIEQTSVTTSSFTIDLAQVTSDQSQRDSQFRGRIMNVSEFPTATFALSEPIAIGAVPADKEQRTFAATGDLTLRGMTKTVTFDLAARRNGDTIEVNGSIPIIFDEWGIPNPSGGPASTEDHGLIEFLVVFAKAG